MTAPTRTTQAAQQADPQQPNTAGLRIMLTVEQAAAALGIGRTSTYALIKSGELRSLLIGRLRRVPLDEIHAYTARLMAQQHPDTPDHAGQNGPRTATAPAPTQCPDDPDAPERPVAWPRLVNGPEPR